MDPNDVIVAYHDFSQSVVVGRSVSTFNQVPFGEDVETICAMMVFLVG